MAWPYLWAVFLDAMFKYFKCYSWSIEKIALKKFVNVLFYNFSTHKFCKIYFEIIFILRKRVKGGILFNNFKPNSMEQLRLSRLETGRPGSPCTKKFLVTNTEFTEQPICTASREYQHLKIKQLELLNLPADELQ